MFASEYDVLRRCALRGHVPVPPSNLVGLCRPPLLSPNHHHPQPLQQAPRTSGGSGDGTSSAASPGAPAPFCLHPRVSASVAGNVCRDCGVVVGVESVAHSNASPADGANRRQPVVDVFVHDDGVVSSSVAVPARPHPSRGAHHGTTMTNDMQLVLHCEQEWQAHVAHIKDQPREVLDRAFDIFRRAYEVQPMSGNKARALILVSLLYTSRLLHGNNLRNEEYLLCHLHIPTRVMNKAFTSLASVIHTLPSPAGQNSADC